MIMQSRIINIEEYKFTLNQIHPIMFKRLVSKTLLAATSVLFSSTVLCNSQKHETYIWGNGYYQARPDALLQFHNFYPKKVNNLPADLVQLFFGEYYEAGIDNKGQLYIWDRHCIDANFDENNRDSQRQGIRLLQKDVKSVRFTSSYIWTVDNNGNVYQWPIIKKFDERGNFKSKQIGQKREIEPLKGTVQLETGRDHVISLNSKGQVYAMGDDTYGQCGQADTDRNTCPPFTQKRIKYPVKVKNLSEVTQISAGNDHNIALDRLGNIYGWGSNSNVQISHEQQFSKMNQPLICSYNALKISKNLDGCQVKKVITGGQFTVIVGQNKDTGSTEVYTFGSNLRGQLGINEIKHFGDVQKVQKLSNYVMKVKGVDQKVTIDQIQCGKGHCLALLNIGYVMEWGDNEYGQLGNRKRSSALAPIILREFVGKKVVSVFAGQNSSAVIVEQSK